MITEAERRLSGRVSLRLPAVSRLAEESAESVSPGPAEPVTLAGLTHDISEGGLRLRVTNRNDLAEGDEVYVRIDTVEPEGFVNVQGRIRWVKPSPGLRREWDIGVELTGEDLSKWVMWLEQMSQWSD